MKLDKCENTILMTLVIAIAVHGPVLSLGLTRDRTSHAPADPSTMLLENSTDNASTSHPSAPVRPSTTPSSSYTTSPADDGYDSAYKQYRFAAVTSDSEICSQIGVLEYLQFFVASAATKHIFPEKRFRGLHLCRRQCGSNFKLQVSVINSAK